MGLESRYIKLFSSALHNCLFQKKPFDEWHAFEYLLLRARYEPTDFILSDCSIIHLERGQHFESIASLSDRFGWSEKKVRCFLGKLEKLEMISVKGGRKGQLITVEKYGFYQCFGQAEGDQRATRGRTEGNQRANRGRSKNNGIESIESKECIEGIKERVLRESKDSLSQSDQIAHGMEANVEAIPLTDGTEWRPTVSEYDEYCRLYPSVDVFDSFRRMRAWSLSNPTKKKTRNGVKRFVNTWLSKEQDNSGKVSTKGSGSAYIDAIHNRMDVVDRWLERTGNDEAGVHNAGEGNESGVF